jgi:succinate dehydrogenase / fumarate reductase iron-sulfur subunit
MEVVVIIKRFNPHKDKQPYYATYDIDAQPDDRVLDLLVHIKHFIDGSLAFRKSCGHGVCGSDAMIINGIERLACKSLVKKVLKDNGKTILIEPLKHFSIKRDLVVDQDPFFNKYISINPYLINNETVNKKERLQSTDEHNMFKDTTSCIFCSACYSACPVLDKDDFLGPAAITQAYRFNADSRDRGFEDRLKVLNSDNGVWLCENHFECTKICPRGIKITKRINQTKSAIEKYNKSN